MPGPTPEDLERLALLDSARSTEEDRRAEIAEYLGEPPPETPPASDYETDLTPLGDEELFRHLEQTARDGVIRNFLKSNRLREAAALVNALGTHFAARDRRSVRVVDFGCGTSDHGLALALAGFSVTVADIPSKVRFAAWRYRRRALPVDALEITAANWRRPPIGPADAIVCGEVLEHLRYPLETSQAFSESLAPGGVLWVSAYPFREKRRGGSHLEEAYLARGEVLRLMKRDYTRLRPEGMPGYLLLRRPPSALTRFLGLFAR